VQPDSAAVKELVIFCAHHMANCGAIRINFGHIPIFFFLFSSFSSCIGKDSPTYYVPKLCFFFIFFSFYKKKKKKKKKKERKKKRTCMIIDFYCQWMATITVLIVPLLIQILLIKNTKNGFSLFMLYHNIFSKPS
jgi:hypothetical protein